MNKFSTFILFVVMSFPLSIFTQQQKALSLNQCSQFFPYGRITGTMPNKVEICRPGYETIVDTTAKIPYVVSYLITPKNVMGCVARKNAFAADQSLSKNERADPKDYLDTGFDMGHLSSYEDNAYDEEIGKQSFLMSNMAPQYPKLNRQVWIRLEEAARDWSYERNHTLLIYVGPIYNIKTAKTIGDDKIVIPYAFYKIIIDTSTDEVLAFIYPNIPELDSNMQKYVSSVSYIEQLTGLDFPLPLNEVDSDLSKWPINLGTFEKAKKEKCK